MKRLLLTLSLIAVSLLIINCSKSDDDEPTGTAGLYGTWDLDYYIDNGQLVEEIPCDEKVTYVFLKNSNYTKTTYAGEGTSKCVVAMIINGTWSNTTESEYELTPNGSDTNENLTIVFQDEFTKFTVLHSASYTEVYSKRN
ncbi:hypothetical protein [Mangrovibacterium sp.]|uniref:hypothetical protein n=1 Tax=Mangrovibacterium sp. TaxID=1961364 RepID=UPI0035685DE4